MSKTTRRTKLSRISHVELRVRNLDESAVFYRELFGLQPMQANPPSDKVCVCSALDPSGEEGISVVLAEGLPPNLELVGMDHLSFGVPAKDDVSEIYLRALQLGARATSPRVFDGRYQTFVFDPNGYKIEVAAEGNGTKIRGQKP
ncbi:MAG: VOC family protein [Phycisphaerales bacterium]|nr:MAG: VOC family protein [Phycisphaerales bacterium]